MLKVLFTGTRYIIQVNKDLEYSYPREKNVLSGIIFLEKVRSMFRLIKTYWKVLLYSTVCQQLWDCQFCCYVSLLLRKQKYHKSAKCSLNLCCANGIREKNEKIFILILLFGASKRWNLSEAQQKSVKIKVMSFFISN